MLGIGRVILDAVLREHLLKDRHHVRMVIEDIAAIGVVTLGRERAKVSVKVGQPVLVSFPFKVQFCIHEKTLVCIFINVQPDRLIPGSTCDHSRRFTLPIAQEVYRHFLRKPPF